VAPFPKKLEPGDYTWHPEISPERAKARSVEERLGADAR
jgi:hypothetical protein